MNEVCILITANLSTFKCAIMLVSSSIGEEEQQPILLAVACRLCSSSEWAGSFAAYSGCGLELYLVGVV